MPAMLRGIYLLMKIVQTEKERKALSIDEARRALPHFGPNDLHPWLPT